MFLRVSGDTTVEAGASIDVGGMGCVAGDGKGVGGAGKNAGGGGHGGKGGAGDAGAVGGTLSVNGGDDGSGAGAEVHRGANGTILVNGVFTVNIESPATGSTRVAGRIIQFKASPTYGLPPFTYTWNFSRQRDGQPDIDLEQGTGEILERSFSEGKYTITLSGMDASGATSEAKIGLVAVSPETAYSATVQADVETTPAGTPVTFTGQAIWLDDTPAAEMGVVVYVTTQGMRRKLPAVATDALGHFKTIWQPLAREAGRYVISADRPNVMDEPPEDEFVLFGAEIEPNCPNTLGPKAAALLKYSIRAVDASIEDARFEVVLSRGQTPVATLHAHVEGVPIAAVLEAYPPEITAGMVRGDQTLVDFEVVNLGGSPSGTLTVCLPADTAAWMSLVTPGDIGPLEPNESTTVTLHLRPEASMPLALYDGHLVVGDGQVEVIVPFRLDCAPAMVGSLTVMAVDELTFYAPGEPKLAGAHVKVIDAQTGRFVGSADANDSGIAEFSNLPDAYYNVEVDADDHGTFRTLLRIATGSRTQLTAFLSRRLAAYKWTILSDETEGRYYFQVEADSVADAPVPVVTVEPLLLNLCNLTAEDTDVKYTFTNDGLLAARNVRLTFRDVAGFEFTPLVDMIDLPAGTSVEVPVRVHDGNLSAGVSGPCDGPNACEVGAQELSYNLRCGDDDLLYKIPFFATAGAGVCYDPSRGGGIVGTGPGVDIAGGGSSVDQVVRCPSCDARVRTRVGQDTMLAGSAFTATLELDNSSSTIPLEKMKIVLAIRDDEGRPSEHLFDCGGPGTYILDYNDLPRLKVDAEYFLERRIYGDDPVTTEVEPAVPFSLGLIVRNQSYATAKDVWIVASAPEIVDHANRRLPDPDVIAVSIGPNDVGPSLQIEIGDLEVSESRVIHWVMQSSFQGRLESWSVEFVQVDGLGGRYPLDVNSVSLHELEHAARAPTRSNMSSATGNPCPPTTRSPRTVLPCPHREIKEHQ